MNTTSTASAGPEHICLGLDIAKAKFDACLLTGSRTRHAQFDNTKTGIAALRAWCEKHGNPAPFIVLEATGRYSELAANTLHNAGHRVHLANPRRIKDHARSLGRRNKTDRIDAELIAHFGTTRALDTWQPASPAQEHLRALLRRHAELQALLQAERNRTETATDPSVTKSLTRILRLLEKEATNIQNQITVHIRSNPGLHADFGRLSAIEGIGPRSAAWLLGELPRHLPNGRAAAAWLAVTPRIRQSGTSVRHTAPVGTEGNRHLRRVLFMAAMSARRTNPRLRAFADRLAAAGKSKMSILIALMHKLVKIAFTLLKKQSHYLPPHFAKN